MIMNFGFDQETPEVGTGGQYLDPGFHGPCYVEFAWENMSPNGNADSDGLAIYVTHQDGRSARIMQTEPPQDNDKALKAVNARMKQLMSPYVAEENRVITGVESFKEFVEKFIEKVGDTSETPVWVKLQYGYKNYPDLGKGQFIAPYYEGQKCPLEIQGDQMQKKEAPKPEADETVEDDEL